LTTTTTTTTMLVPYYPDESKEAYHNYYVNQAGRGIGVFQGSTVQRGHGIGNLLQGLAKSTLPLLKQGGKMLGKQLLNTGVGIVKDVMDGRSLAQSTRENFKEGGLSLLSDLSSKLRNGPHPPNKRLRRPPRRAPPRKRPRRRAPSTLLANVEVEG
jgi:hypothetical protein